MIRRRRRDPLSRSTPKQHSARASIGFVLSGGGSRAAYQVGALKALTNVIERSDSPISVIVGSSIGAVNSLVLGTCLIDGYRSAVEQLEDLWLERTFSNSFSGAPSMTFLRAVKIALLKYARDPGPHASDDSIFDPTPLVNRISGMLQERDGFKISSCHPDLFAVGAMTTVEGPQRKPLLFLCSREPLDESDLVGASFEAHHVDHLTAHHGFASAALPTVLPPVELNTDQGTIRLVDGGISQNIPVDPAVRLGAERVIILDVSGRDWWFDQYGEAHDTRPDWEIAAEPETFCLRPPETMVARCAKPLGPLLKDAVGRTTRTFIQALGATWPVYTLIKRKTR